MKHYIFRIITAAHAILAGSPAAANEMKLGKEVLRRGFKDNKGELRVRSYRWPFNGKNRAQRNRLSAAFQSM